MGATVSYRTFWFAAGSAILIASIASAQQVRTRNGWWGRVPPKWASASDLDGSFPVCCGEEPRDYFDTFSPTGDAIGVNVVLYAMTR